MGPGLHPSARLTAAQLAAVAALISDCARPRALPLITCVVSIAPLEERSACAGRLSSRDTFRRVSTRRKMYVHMRVCVCVWVSVWNVTTNNSKLSASHSSRRDMHARAGYLQGMRLGELSIYRYVELYACVCVCSCVCMYRV